MFKKNFTREFFNDSDLIECYLDYVRIRFVRGRFYFATFHFRSRAYYLIFFFGRQYFQKRHLTMFAKISRAQCVFVCEERV